MVFAQTWRVVRGIRRERKIVEAWCRRERFELIIADHRFGCRSSFVRSVFIGHQLSIPVSGWWKPFSGIINRIHWSMISGFDTIWVPDYPDRRLSGDLSRADLLKIEFIGPLSRFRRPLKFSSRRYCVVAVVSGPDPMRRHFVEQVAHQLEALDEPTLLITGEPGNQSGPVHREKLEILPHLDSDAFSEVLLSAGHVLSRSGYSSLMDYAVLGIKPWLVPTPGQPEQEYLASRLSNEHIAPFQQQHELSVNELLKDQRPWTGFSPETSGRLLDDVFDREPALKRFQDD